MKILHLLVSGEVGGIEVLMKNYAAHSVHENHFAFLWQGGRIAEQMRQNGAAVTVLNIRQDGWWKTCRRVVALCKEESFDAVVSHNSAPFLKLMLLFLKIRFPGIRTLAYAHANARDICDANRKKGLWLRKLIHTIAYRKADGIIAISRSVGQSLTEYLHIPQTKIRVIYNGTPIPECSRDSVSGRKLIYVGRLIPEKGVQVTLRALALLPGMEFTFDIVGDGPYRPALQTLTEQLGLSDRVRFLGSRQDVPELLARADIFAHMPVWEEGFGITVIEAMAAGCICICAASGAIPEIITDGVDGFLVPKEDPDALAERLTAVLRCENAAVGRRAAARAEDFSIDRFSAELDGYILQITGKGA